MTEVVTEVVTKVVTEVVTEVVAISVLSAATSLPIANPDNDGVHALKNIFLAIL